MELEKGQNTTRYLVVGCRTYFVHPSYLSIQSLRLSNRLVSTLSRHVYTTPHHLHPPNDFCATDYRNPICTCIPPLTFIQPTTLVYPTTVTLSASVSHRLRLSGFGGVGSESRLGVPRRAGVDHVRRLHRKLFLRCLALPDDRGAPPGREDVWGGKLGGLARCATCNLQKKSTRTLHNKYHYQTCLQHY